MPEQVGFPNLSQSVFLVIGFMAIMVGIGVIVSLFNLPIPMAVLFLLMYSLSLGVFILLGIRKKQQFEGGINWIWKINSNYVLLLVLLTGVLISISLDPLAEYIPISEGLLSTMKMLGKPTLLSFVTIVIAPALLEELLFRGIILDGLSKNMSAWKAILISSLLFGLVHGYPIQIVAATLGGIFFGWIYLRTGSILYPILLHAVNNFIGWYFVAFITTDLSLRSVIGGNIEYYSLITGSTIIAAGAIFILTKKLESLGTN